MQYTVTGEADMGRETQPFEKEIEAESEDHAREIIYSEFGSKHGASRANVTIDSVEEQG
ncbi:MAG: 50S ribosomal protein L18Ae [Candidatus Nanohaloarchaea archaeon]|nr:50S ribosomal protein L18Ae [Candidatus Nanohaloarchaea archaeon]